MHITFQRSATGLRPGCEGTGRGCGHGHRHPHPQPAGSPSSCAWSSRPGSSGASGPPRRSEPLVIHGANAAEERAIDWSIRRYREAGLEGMPDLEVYVHRSNEGCRDGIGYYLAGRIDLCTKASSEPYQRKFALHEMAHGWIEANVDGAVLDRFMQVRGIATWNDRSFDWKERGTEQAAEIVTWGLGEGEIAPLLPEAVDDPRRWPRSTSCSPAASRSMGSSDEPQELGHYAGLGQRAARSTSVAEGKEHTTPEARSEGASGRPPTRSPRSAPHRLRADLRAPQPSIGAPPGQLGERLELLSHPFGKPRRRGMRQDSMEYRKVAVSADRHRSAEADEIELGSPRCACGFIHARDLLDLDVDPDRHEVRAHRFGLLPTRGRLPASNGHHGGRTICPRMRLACLLEVGSV